MSPLPLTVPTRRFAVVAAVVIGAAFAAPITSLSAQPAALAAAPGARVEELLAAVRDLNPEVAAAALDREAAAAKVFPAGALDDPTINFTRDQGFRQTLVTVTQEFPLWGKRALRREIAEAGAAAARGRE